MPPDAGWLLLQLAITAGLAMWLAAVVLRRRLLR